MKAKKRATRKPAAKRAKAADTGLVRSFLSGDPLSWSWPYARTAGTDVTDDTALTLPVYYACLRVLSQTVAMLPMGAREQTGRGSRKLPDHRITWILNNPHPWMTKSAFWQLLLHWAAGWGLGLARIDRDGRGDPVRMVPMHPGNVRPFVDGEDLWWEWKYWTEAGPITEYVPDSACFRIHGMGGDGVTGYSLIRYAAEALGQGLAHQSYGSSFFSNGVWGSGVIEHPQVLKPEMREALRKSIRERFAGSRNSFQPLLFEGGLKWTSTAIPNEDAQLVQFGNFNGYQVCLVIGVQPHKVGLLEGAKYKNIEEENVAWVQDGVLPWATRIEEEGQRKLLFRPGRLYAHVNVNGLLRADHATRFESYQKAVNSGWMTPNQVAELEDMPANPSDAGDAYYIQGAMRNLEDVYKPPEPPAAAAAPAPMPMEPPMEDEEEERGEGHPEQEESVDGRLYVAGQPTAWAALAETQRPAFVARFAAA